MRKSVNFSSLIPIYLLIFVLLFLIAIGGSRAVTTFVENRPFEDRKCIIIDAGHGGVDGGATSCTGILESNINLEIANRLNDILHLLGIKTVMVRDSDRSLHTQEGTIAQMKVSDLKARVNLVNRTEKAILISIHQNYYSDSRYYGPQVFYANTDGSAALAEKMQKQLKATLCPETNRVQKPANGVYLMQKINCTGLLVECGFLSNPSEEAKLLSDEYQKKLSCVIACVCSQNLADAKEPI